MGRMTGGMTDGAGTVVRSGAMGTARGAGVRPDEEVWTEAVAATGADARLRVAVRAECTTEDLAVGA